MDHPERQRGEVKRTNEGGESTEILRKVCQIITNNDNQTHTLEPGTSPGGVGPWSARTLGECDAVEVIDRCRSGNRQSAPQF